MSRFASAWASPGSRRPRARGLVTEVLFYHLQRQPLEAVLPTLLARSRERGWRALVRLATPERLAALDDHLWSYSDESFLPHGRDDEPHRDEQPVLLTLGEENANGAQILLVAEGAPVPEALDGYARIALLLDGADEEAVASARLAWRRLKEGGHSVTYWQQDEGGRWAKRA